MLTNVFLPPDEDFTIKEAIVLAGGLGTRLRSAVPDLPKCMAPVNNKPFIGYVIDYYVGQGIDKFIFSLGYKHEVIENYLNQAYPSLSRQNVVEPEPLGTGGAIRLACKVATEKTVLVLNGDTIFNIELATLSDFHYQHDSHCTLSLKPMRNFDRYGVVELEPDNRIKSFKEKQFYDNGLINGGVYALNVPAFMQESMPDKFSFEKDYMELKYADGHMHGVVQEGYFIDIGIPADYERAQREFC
jgi:D-glycero-alpha-D-manno-heptose 1-phosphate guanylyltransferase